jgi:YVTN family beta-propeller protein
MTKGSGDHHDREPATPVATIAVGQDPISMAADQATGMVYVACTGPTADVYAIDSATNTVTATIPVGHDPQAIGVDAATDTVYVAMGRTTR